MTTATQTRDTSWERLPAPYPDLVIEPDQPFPALAHLSLRLKTYRHLLATRLAGPAGRSLLDLGAGPGHFARIASRQGFAVTAVDAREPWTLTGRTASRPIREYDFVRMDLRRFERLREFDVIAMIGVIYHLPLEDQLGLLAACRGKVVIIDTEIFDPAAIAADRRHRFTRRVTAEGYAGADCLERGQVYSSHLNPSSFWFEEESFARAIADLGFPRVTVLDPPYRSAFGPRRWYVLDG
jgi:SAM-dependent methyltransferase